MKKETTNDTINEKQKEEEKKNRAKSKFLNLLLSSESDEEDQDDAGFVEAMKSLHINGKWILRNIPMFLLLALGLAANITCRYIYEKQSVEKARLNKEQIEWTNRLISVESDITIATRQSYIERKLKELGDSTLLSTTESPFTIVKEKAEEQ